MTRRLTEDIQATMTTWFTQLGNYGAKFSGDTANIKENLPKRWVPEFYGGGYRTHSWAFLSIFDIANLKWWSTMKYLVNQLLHNPGSKSKDTSRASGYLYMALSMQGRENIFQKGEKSMSCIIHDSTVRYRIVQFSTNAAKRSWVIFSISTPHLAMLILHSDGLT